MRSFTYDALPGQIVFGAGCSRSAVEPAVRSLGCRRVFAVVAGDEIALASDILRQLGGSLVATYTGVRPHVPAEVVTAALSEVERTAPDVLLCIGGGSTTGLAKALALHTSLSIIAIPTTYAGSEVTPVWGVTEGSRKTTGRAPSVLPKVVIYDSELTVSLPLGMTVASAGNALAHCVEAFYAAGANPITDLVAAEGIRAVVDGLPRVRAEPSDTVGRDQLLYAAYLAGSAFAVAGSGLHHKICHVLGGSFNLPHAEMHSLLLPYVAAFNAVTPAANLAPAAAALGSPTVPAGLNAVLGAGLAVSSLLEIGLAASDIEPAVDLIMEKEYSDNPRPVTRDGVRGIIIGALHGVPPERVAGESAGALR